MSEFSKRDFANKVVRYCKFINAQARKGVGKDNYVKLMTEEFSDYDPYIGMFVMMLPNNVRQNITVQQATLMADTFKTTYENRLKDNSVN